jgi:chromosomal replication initiation ATPase DnaA
MARQLRLSLGRSSLPSFDDFARGPSNVEAVAAVQAWPAWTSGCLALIGPGGSGKSHLANAWAAATGAVVLDAGAPDLASAAGRPALLEDADRGPGRPPCPTSGPG